MNIGELKKRAREIWGEEKLSLQEIVVRLGVVFGDIARFARGSSKDQHLSDDELKKELGNVIFSSIRWCDDLGYDSQECIEKAIEAQEKFAAENKDR